MGVGHRVVHGGADLSAPVRITDAVLQQLEDLVPFAINVVNIGRFGHREGRIRRNDRGFRQRPVLLQGCTR